MNKKHLFFLIFHLCFALIAAGQAYAPSNLFGQTFNRGIFYYQLGIPQDTVSLQGIARNYPHIARIHDVTYFWSVPQGRWIIEAGGSGGSATGAASGDLNGNYPSPTVIWANGYSAYDARYQTKGNYAMLNSYNHLLIGTTSDNGSSLRVIGYVDIGGNQGSMWYVNSLGHLQELVAPAGLVNPQLSWDATNIAPKWVAGGSLSQIQSDWLQTNTSAADFIKNKPTINNSGTTSSGSYTPTITGNSGIALTNAYACYWTRVGDIVTVSGQIDIQVVNANTVESLLMSLPVLPNANFSNRFKLNGVMNCEAYYVPGVIYASASQQLAWLSFQVPGTLLKDWHFTFTYSATQP